MEKRHVISVLVENKPGVLARVSGMFSGRAYNIHSLSVAPTLSPDVSRMTVVTHGSDAIIEQIIKQLRKLINIIKVQDLTLGDYVDREMALVRVKATAAKRGDVLRIVDIFRGKVVDIAPDSMMVEITGGAGKIEAMIELLSPLGILELIRTGTVALPRGRKQTRYSEPSE